MSTPFPPQSPPRRRSPGQTFRAELRPGVVCEVTTADEAVPKYVLAKLTKRTDGTYFLGVMEWTQHVRMSVTLARDLGLPFDDNTLYRLIKAGFVAAAQPSPGCYMVDLASIARHIEATKVKPGEPPFWTEERRDAYRNAC